jgi:hypothetical protein
VNAYPVHKAFGLHVLACLILQCRELFVPIIEFVAARLADLMIEPEEVLVEQWVFCFLNSCVRASGRFGFGISEFFAATAGVTFRYLLPGADVYSRCCAWIYVSSLAQQEWDVFLGSYLEASFRAMLAMVATGVEEAKTVLGQMSQVLSVMLDHGCAELIDAEVFSSLTQLLIIGFDRELEDDDLARQDVARAALKLWRYCVWRMSDPEVLARFLRKIEELIPHVQDQAMQAEMQGLVRELWSSDERLSAEIWRFPN